MERICLICGEEFETYPSYVKRGGGLYCSRTCQDKAQSIRMKTEPPEKTPHWKGGKVKVLCANCDKELEVKPCLVKERNFCSRSCSASFNVKLRPLKGSVLKCRICGKEFYRSPSAINRKQKKPQYCSQRCRAIDSIRNQRKQETDIEQELEATLIELGLEFKKQKVIENICLADFFIAPNICIFADGDYWHSLEGRVKVDERQNKELVEAGYRVVRMKGKDILSGDIKDKICSIIS